jgi:hypothetical protein
MAGDHAGGAGSSRGRTGCAGDGGRRLRSTQTAGPRGDEEHDFDEWIWVAAGTDSAIFRVTPRTLRMLSNAVVAPVATASWMTARRASWNGATTPSPAH